MNLRPSPAQIEAGNYSKDHVSVHGLRVSIENPAGSTRRGKGADGKPWASKMHNDYGYIRGTTGRDKDHVDVFLSDSHRDSSLPVHVVDQVDPATGEFDEHKVMLGWPDEDSAMEAYLKHYPAGWDGAKAVTAMSLPDFKKWAFQSGRRVKPVSELGVAKFCGGGAVRKYADGGAAFGVFPQLGRRAPANNDRTDSADMPFQAARGWAAGTAGLPGDMEGVMRQLIKAGAAPDSWVGRNLSTDPALPTSEFYKEWLPGAPKGAGSRAAMELGSLIGGAGSTTGARVLKKGADAAALGLGRAVDKGMAPGALLSKIAPAAQPMYAVKPKGGNWDPTEPWDMVDQYVFGGPQRGGPPGRQALPGDGMDAMMPAGGPRVDPVEGWRAKQLQKYVRNLMGTADDPLLKLEKEGRLHLSPEDVIDRANQEGHFAQRGADNTSFDGDPTHLKLTGRPHRTPWEALSDSLVEPRTPENVRYSTGELWGTPVESNKIADMARANPGAADDLKDFAWLDKVPEDSPIWATSAGVDDSLAGFTHVNDYLKHAVRTQGWADNTGRAIDEMAPVSRAEMPDLNKFLARGLGLTPEQLARTSVPDAVAKTAEWNKLLAEGKRLEDMNKGVKAVHRQYDTGHQWVELSPEGLAGEGKAMRHCVGGYCSSVESGDTRILSLRDKEGQPRVTVEVAPGKPWSQRSGVFYDNPELEPSWVNYHNLARAEAVKDPAVKRVGEPAIMQKIIEGYPDWLAKNEPQVFSKYQKVFQPDPPTIRQIKGPANRAPSAEVQAHVQDLVRNGLGDGLSGWSKVGDLKNSGLTQHSGRYWTRPELEAAAKAHGRVQNSDWPTALQRHLDAGISEEDALKNFMDAFDTRIGGVGQLNLPEGYKTGGSTNHSEVAMQHHNFGSQADWDNWIKGLSGPPAGLKAGGVVKNGVRHLMEGGGGDVGGGFDGGGYEGGYDGGDYGGNNWGGPDVSGPAPSQSAGSKIADFMLGLAVPGYGLMNGLSKAATDKSLSQQLSEAFSNFGVGSGTQSTDQGEPDHYEGAGIGALGSVLGAADMNALAPEVVNGTVGAGAPWADPMALGNHALRVYDPVFAPGTAAPRGY